MFDLGPKASVHIGECALLTSVWFLCDEEISIGAYTTISWSVVIMDTYRMPLPDFQSVYLAERETEVATLTDPRITTYIRESGIRLVTFGDYPKVTHH